MGKKLSTKATGNKKSTGKKTTNKTAIQESEKPQMPTARSVFEHSKAIEQIRETIHITTDQILDHQWEIKTQGESRTITAKRVRKTLKKFLPMYETLFTQIGIRLPLSPFQISILKFLEVPPAQLHPSAWAFIRAFEIFTKSRRVTTNTNVFFCLFSPFCEKPTKSTSYTHYSPTWIQLKVTTGVTTFKQFKDFSEDFHEQFFFITAAEGFSPFWQTDNDGLSDDTLIPLYWNFKFSIKENNKFNISKESLTPEEKETIVYINDWAELAGPIKTTTLLQLEESKLPNYLELHKRKVCRNKVLGDITNAVITSIHKDIQISVDPRQTTTSTDDNNTKATTSKNSEESASQEYDSTSLNPRKKRRPSIEYPTFSQNYEDWSESEMEKNADLVSQFLQHGSSMVQYLKRCHKKFLKTKTTEDDLVALQQTTKSQKEKITYLTINQEKHISQLKQASQRISQLEREINDLSSENQKMSSANITLQQSEETLQTINNELQRSNEQLTSKVKELEKLLAIQESENKDMRQKLDDVLENEKKESIRCVQKHDFASQMPKSTRSEPQRCSPSSCSSKRTIEKVGSW